MKTAIVTWITYRNFGTFLQAYALQQVIQGMGYEAWIIDDSRFLLKDKSSVRQFAYYIKQRILKSILLGNTKYYDNFRRNFLRVDSVHSSFQQLNNQYDTFICGSDQIWSAHAKKISPYFYLAFVASGKRCISYAPSTGTNEFSEAYCKTVKPWIERLDAISVRERSCAEMLRAFIEREVKVVLDPTLLLSKEQWLNLVTPVDDSDYILCYFLTPNRWYMDYAQTYAKKVGKRLLIFATNDSYRNYGDRMLAAGPQEFVSYIYYADRVFTDSFHGSIFSLLFEKEFVTFKRFEDNHPQNQNARVKDLFNMLGILSRFIDQTQLDCIECLPPLSFESINEKLNQKKRYSLDFLRTNLY